MTDPRRDVAIWEGELRLAMERYGRADSPEHREQYFQDATRAGENIALLRPVRHRTSGLAERLAEIEGDVEALEAGTGDDLTTGHLATQMRWLLDLLRSEPSEGREPDAHLTRLVEAPGDREGGLPGMARRSGRSPPAGERRTAEPGPADGPGGPVG